MDGPTDGLIDRLFEQMQDAFSKTEKVLRAWTRLKTKQDVKKTKQNKPTCAIRVIFADRCKRQNEGRACRWTNAPIGILNRAGYTVKN